MNLFYRPAQGWVGDVIPFADGDEAVLFFLHDLREPGVGTPWDVVRTRDFVTYVDSGRAVPSGGAAAADFNAYTGSVVRDGDRHHLFYTGHNPALIDPDTGDALQLVMHAISDDGMTTWTKVPEDTFGAPDGYERSDWRDPFVFRPDSEGPWRMVIAARRDTGPLRRRGLLAQAVSWDLRTWQVVEPFWDPGLYIAHECPDVFRMGKWWYLVYSEFSEAFTTRYRMSRDPLGPWLTPPSDTLDGRAFYAAKTIGYDTRRFAVGWIPTKEGGTDDGPWQWAGQLAVHELRQAHDGTLDVSLPGTVRAAFEEAALPELRTATPGWSRSGSRWTAEAPDTFAALVGPELPAVCLVRVEVEIRAGTRAVGVILRGSDDLDAGYQVRLEPPRGRMVMDRWPRARTGPMQWEVSGDVPHLVELERACELAPGRHSLEVVMADDACITYLDGRVAMSARLYDRPTGRLGLFVQEGAATFESVTISNRT